MKILLLGSRGRLGAALAREWGSVFEVRSMARPEVDVAVPSSLAAVLDSCEWDAVVNCTGLTSLEVCEDDPGLARTVNAEAPATMAREASSRGKICIHISTDYVFDGEGSRLLAEDDAARPLSVYGRSKLDGEEAVLAESPGHLVFRVSWVFGPDKPSFIDAILARAESDERVEAVADKFSSPTYTLDAAAWLRPFLGGGLGGGLYHACNSGICTWRDFAQEAIDIAASLGHPLKAREVAPLALAEMKAFRAARPVFTAMDCAKLSGALGVSPRPWQEALRDYLASSALRP